MTDVTSSSAKEIVVVLPRPSLSTRVAGLALGALLVATGCTALPGGGGQAAPGTAGTSTPTGAAASATEGPSEGAEPSASDLPSSPAAATPSSTPEPSSSPTSAKPSPSRPPTSPPAPAALLERGDSGDRVRELQHRLRQLEWFSGTITGRYAGATVTAVSGFQEKRRLPSTGAVDQKTWDKLAGMTQRPSRDDMYNILRPGPAILERGDDGDKVRELQARLKQIAWYSGKVTGSYGPATATAVRGFQGKRAIPVTGEVDARTWSRLTAMTRTPSRNEKLNIVPKPSATGLDPRCLTGRAMCVSKRTNSLVWVVDGTPQLRLDVRFGSAELPTRNGSFRVGWKSRDHVSSLYHTPMPYAMFFSGGQAVHYSPDFARRGYNGRSHGCVNVRNLGAIQGLFGTVRVGDKVIVYS